MPRVRLPRVDRATVAVAGAYLALSLLVQRSLVAALGGSVYAQDVPGSDALLLVWTLAWDQHALWTNPLGLFDGNIFRPHLHTLLYADHLLGLALLTAPLRLVTDNAVLVHNVITVSAPALSALAMYALARSLVGVPGPAFVAGLVYGFAAVRLSVDRCHLGMLAAWWLPLVLLFGRRALDGGRWRDALAAGGALLFQGLSGIYLTAFFLPLLGVAHLHWLRAAPPRTHGRGWVRLLACEAVAGLVLLPTAIAYRTVQHELGVERSVVVNALLALRPEALPGLLPTATLGVTVLAVLLLGDRLPAAFRRERGFLLLALAGAFVFALGPSITLPGGLGAVRGPYGLLVDLPGASALRAPGRMIHLVLLCGALLAAGGLAALAAGRGTAARAALVVAASATVVAESWTGPWPTLPVGRPLAVSPSTVWLSRQPEPLRYVEFPTGVLLESSVQQYYSTAHFHETLNGNMGLIPPMFPYVAEALGRFPAPDVLDDLRALGVTTVVAHLNALPPAQQAAILAATGPGGPLEERFASPGIRGTRIVTLRDTAARPPAPLPGVPLARAGWRVTASHDAVDAPLAVDDDPATAWTSWGGLASDLAAWRAPVGFPARWTAFLATAPATFSVDLGAPARVAAVTLHLGGSDALLAPTLRLAASDDGVTWRDVPARLRPVPDAAALVTDAAAARFALVPETPVHARHLRLSGTLSEWRLGDLGVRALEGDAA